MSERSVPCPICPFQFARLIDAGGYHAYQCPVCDWRQETTDRRPGNRPADVCALCDTVIQSLAVGEDHHLYLGTGWVHGGGREYIPIHGSCLSIAHYPAGCPAYEQAARQVLGRLVAA